MTTKFSSASFELGVRTVSAQAAAARDPAEPFTILLLGDYTGRVSRDLTETLNARKLIAMDTDNFDQVLARLEVRLRLALPAGAQSEFSFPAMQAFHPDQLLRSELFLAKLSETRRRLLNPAKAKQGEAELRALLGATGANPAAQAPTTETGVPESDDETMARLLGGTPPKISAAPTSPVEQFIRQVVSPHMSPADSDSRTEALAAAEMEMTSRLNAILHHPSFQALEAAWRGVDLLVRRIESPEEIQLRLLDVSLTELQADLVRSELVEESGLFRLLRDRKPRLIIGNYTFGQNRDDLRTLTRIAGIAAQLSAPFVAAGATQLVGCDSFSLHPDPDDWKTRLPADTAEAWETLRNSPHARFVGLAAPRFLLRQPYGKSGDAIETFPFEEMPGEPIHESFLWGQPGLLCACAAIDALQSGDPELTEFTGGQIDDLPVHKYLEDGETVVKSYAEAWLTDRAVDRMLARGILPVVPVKNQNVVRLNHLRSVAGKPTPLAFA